MTLTIAVALLCAVVGAFLYAISANAKVAEMGRIAFMVGLFFCVWAVSGRTWRLS